MKLIRRLTCPDADTTAPFSVKFFLYTGILSLFGSLGFLCLLGFLVTSPTKNPYAHPFYVVCGYGVLVVCVLVAMLCLTTLRYARHKLASALLGLAVTVTTFLPFALLWDAAIGGLRELAHTFLI